MIKVPARQPVKSNLFHCLLKRPDWLSGQTSPLYNWAQRAPSAEVKRPRRESDHSPPSCGEVKNDHHFPIPLHGVQRENFTLLQHRGKTPNTVNYSPISGGLRSVYLCLHYTTALIQACRSAGDVSHRTLASAGSSHDSSRVQGLR